MPHAIQFNNPLGAETLRFHALLLRESLGQVSEGRLSALSKNRQIDIDALLGQKVSLAIETQHWGVRYHSAYVTRFEVGARHEQDTMYHIELRPWLWFLSRTADCRIFQNQTVPQIIQSVLADCPVSVVSSRLTRDYPLRPYVVQYRESDLNFVQRIMEREGIYFFFEHTEDNHTLVLADSLAAHTKLEGGYATIPYSDGANALGMSVDKESLNVWRAGKSIQSGAYVLNDYDFTRPRADMTAVAMLSRPHPHADYELYDYPGEFKQHDIGDLYVRTRLEEWQSQHERMFAAGGVRGCEAGGLFTLERHPRPEQNQDYLIVTATTRLEESGYESSGGQFHASVEMEVQPTTTVFRPARVTPKPFVQGPQTAVVVGPPGEEIWCDEHGRVKVQFHWDRYGKKDDHSSCWVRVSNPWAGAGFGAQHIPRIGQEVVVSFLEGDPDHPMITGRVYNAENTPPWALPANKTQSGVLTRSSKGGGPSNANALRFEDKKGAEEVWLHAERNQRIEVERDESHWVGNDRLKTIDHDETTRVKNDRTEWVGHDETIKIDNDRTETVLGNEKIFVQGNREEEVGGDETLKMDGNRTETVKGNETITVEKNRGTTVLQSERLHVVGSRTALVDADENIVIKGNRDTLVKSNATLLVEGDQKTTVNGHKTITAQDGVTLNTPKTFKISAKESVDTSGSTSTTTTSPSSKWFAVDDEKVTLFMAKATLLSVDVKGVKTEATGLSVGFNGVKLESNFLKKDMSLADWKSAALRMLDAMAEVNTGGIYMSYMGFHMFM